MNFRRRTEHSQHAERFLLSFAHPRVVLLTNPTIIVALGLFVISLVFTVWPQVLEHSPISFEKRGVIHHIWHYSLLGGSLLTIYGAFSDSAYRLQFEFFGWLFVMNALAMNLVAQFDTFLESGTAAVQEGVTGIGLGLRIIVLLMVLLRMCVLYFEPKVSSPITNIVVKDPEVNDE